MRRLGIVLILALAGCGRVPPAWTPDLPPALAKLYEAAARESTAEADVAVGRAEAQRRNWPPAIDAYEKALAVEPDHPAALAELANLRLAHGERNEALRLVTQLDSAHPDDASVQATVGDLYAQLGMVELSLGSYRKALSCDPKQPLALLRLGVVATRKGRFDEARGYRDRLVAVAPNWPETRGLVLLIARESGDGAEVERLLREAHAENPTPVTLQALANFLAGLGRHADVVAVCEAWLADHPDDLAASIVRAEALSQKGAKREARKALRQLTERDPEDPRVHLAYGRALLEQGLKDQGAAELNRALELAPADTRLRLRVADYFARYHQTRRAYELYDQVAREDPRLQAEAAQRRGMVLQEMGATAQEGAVDPIEANYRLAILGNSDDFRALNNLAFHYAEQNRELKAARAMIERAIELHGDDPNLEDTLAWVAIRAADYDTAREAIEKALAGRTDDPLVHYHQAVLLDAIGDSIRALAEARRALGLGNSFIGRDDCLALVERLEGRK